MNNIILSGLTDAPKGKKALAVQLAYCFFVSFIILAVISSVVTSAYVSKLERERADTMMLVASSSAVAISGVPIELGMEYPLPIYSYDETNNYLVNIYVHAHSSFIRVYSSYQDEQLVNPEMPVTLEGGGEEYIKAYQLEKIAMAVRVEDDQRYYAAVAPIITSVGGVSGIIEVMMPEEDFSSTVNGFSLSWIFTIISISISFTLVYYQLHRLFITLSKKPDSNMPKIIRYGLDGCKLIAFFSAMACVMPPIISSAFIRQSMSANGYTDIFIYLFILFGLILYAMGFWGFRSFRVSMFKRFTSRLSTAVSAMILFVLLLVAGLVSNEYLWLLLILPISFLFGMVFFFQREYRGYAGRLGHEGFEESTIHRAQFSSQVYGAIVGSVVAGILFERHGLFSVFLLSGAILLAVAVLTMIFIQHCPSSKEPPLQLTRYLYALINRNSGSFLWSSVVTSGIQIAFFVGFVPLFLRNVGISIATVSFYYLVFAICCCLLTCLFESAYLHLFSMKSRLIISSVIQIIGYLIFAAFPSAKVLVITACLLGLGMSFQGGDQIDFYTRLIREDKRQYAKSIVERAFSTGVTGGALLFGVILFFTDYYRVPLLVFVAIFSFISLVYPVVSFSSSSNKGHKKRPVQSHSVADQTSANIENVVSNDPYASYIPEQQTNYQGPFESYEQENQWQSYNDSGYSSDYTDSAFSDYQADPFASEDQRGDEF